MEITVNFGTETLNAINNLAGALSVLSNISANMNTAETQTFQQAAIPTSTPAVTTTTTVPEVQVSTVTPPTAGQAAVPTATVSYTRDDLARSAGFLMEQNRGNELVAILAKYGVQALTELPVELYGSFAADLRALGANI